MCFVMFYKIENVTFATKGDGNSMGRSNCKVKKLPLNYYRNGCKNMF